MADELVKKILYEYDLFFLDCMRQSKAGIYARSHEIEAKKRIKRLLEHLEVSDLELYEKLLILDNIIEDAYRYIRDYGTGLESEDEMLHRWLSAIAKKAEHA